MTEFALCALIPALIFGVALTCHHFCPSFTASNGCLHLNSRHVLLEA